MTRVRLILLLIFFAIPVVNSQTVWGGPAQENLLTQTSDNSQILFDDKMLLDGYTKKFTGLPLEIILEMIKDETLISYKTAAAVRVFREQYASKVVSLEKKGVEKILLRRLNRTDSVFVQVEILHTLGVIDRYKYFQWAIPPLIQKLDHYNTAVNEIAFVGIDNLVNMDNNKKAREARIVFETLRKVLFLSRNRLAKVTTPDTKLTQKLKLLRWSIKVLGNQELKRLPKEIIRLL